MIINQLYNLTNVTSLEDSINVVNYQTGTLFGSMFLILIFIIFFLAIKRNPENTIGDAITAGGFMSTIIGVLLYQITFEGQPFLDERILIGSIVVTAVGFFLIYIKNK